MGVPWFLEVARLNPFLLEDEATLAQRVCSNVADQHRSC